MVQRPYPLLSTSHPYLPPSYSLPRAFSIFFFFSFIVRTFSPFFCLVSPTCRCGSFLLTTRSSTRFFLHKQQVINRRYSGRSYLPYLVETLLFSSMRVLERDDSYPRLPPPRITLSNVLLVCCAISWPTMIGDNTVFHSGFSARLRFTSKRK